MRHAARQRAATDVEELRRRCPGESYEISVAICSARQANSFPKCLLCSHYSDADEELPAGDPRIRKSIFRSSVIAGEVPEEINEYVMRKLGSAAGQFLKAAGGGKTPVAIACDRRENSRNLSRIFAEGIESAGMPTVNLGPAMPDMLRFAMIEHEMSAAAFISGCNAGATINGIRIIDRDGRPVLYDTGIEKIWFIARRMKPARLPTHGKNRTLRILPEYRSFLLSRMMPEPCPFRVVIDGSEGIGGEVLPYVLAKTSLKIIKSHCEPDAKSSLLGLRFPAGQVNTSVQQAIRSNEADIGMAVDYDGDLCFFYDEEGNMLRSDIAAALIANEVLQLKPGAKIAYDLRSSAAFAEEVQRAGGRPVRSGYIHGLLNEAVVSGAAEYAFDIGGRHIFKAFRGGESPLMALMLLCSAMRRRQEPLSDMAGSLCRYVHSGVISHEMPTPEKAASVIETLMEEFPRHENDEPGGLTFREPSWWFHVRRRAQSRIIEICIEGATKEDEKAGRGTIEDIIRQFQNRR